MTERERTGPEHWPLLSLFLTWIGGTVLLVMIGSGLGLMREEGQYLELVVYLALMAPPVAWTARQLRVRKLGWDVLFGPRPAATPWRDLLALAAGLMALSVGSIWALWWPLSFVWPGLVESWLLDQETLLLAGHTPLGRAIHAAIMMLLIGLVAPVVEELLFRGVLLRRWSRLWGPAWGVLVSSTLFGLLHVDLLGSVYFGFALCTLALRHGGVRLAILVHVLNNASAVTLGLIDELFHISGPAWTIEDFRSHAVWALPLFALSAAWAVWWGRRAVRGIEWRPASLSPSPPASPPASTAG